MLKDVVSAKYKDGYKIEVKFEDNATGIIDFAEYLSRGGVFEKFKNIDYFKNFRINTELGVLTWSDEIEIAPETLYAKATGSSMPDWMNYQNTKTPIKTFEQTS